MKYLIPEPRKRHHSVVSHILADDGETALCVYNPEHQTWPQVEEGNWKIADDAIDDYVCSRCIERKRRMEAPPPLPQPKRNKRLERELEKLTRWNEAVKKAEKK